MTASAAILNIELIEKLSHRRGGKHGRVLPGRHAGQGHLPARGRRDGDPALHRPSPQDRRLLRPGPARDLEPKARGVHLPRHLRMCRRGEGGGGGKPRKLASESVDRSRATPVGTDRSGARSTDRSGPPAPENDGPRPSPPTPPFQPALAAVAPAAGCCNALEAPRAGTSRRREGRLRPAAMRRTSGRRPRSR